MKLKQLPTLTTIVLLIGILGMSHFAQSQEIETRSNKSRLNEKHLDNFTNDKLASILTTSPRERLEELQSVINEKAERLKDLKHSVKVQGSDSELERLIQDTTKDLEISQKSFEEIVIGTVSADLFEEEMEPATWQEELTLVVKPLLSNLRGLTEKPRQKEKLKLTIEEQDSIISSTKTALTAINFAKEEKHSADVNQELKRIKTKWQSLADEAQRKKELASLSLAKLDEQDEGLFQKFKASMKEFARERGLTLLIAFVVSLLIILFFRMLAQFMEKRRKQYARGENRTTYRVLMYAQRLMMVVVILTAILVVFFIRGDALLLALMLIFIFATVMSFKNFLPQFIQESRLLLNIGSVREQELINYNGVPWRVASINVFSLLVNPEIRGLIRLPLSELKNLHSRKVKDEKWFPSAINDWVLDDDNNLYEVINQTPDAVELQSSQGTNKLVPTAEYYAAGFVNLTQSNKMRITGTFGVDYSLQAIALDVVPEKLRQGAQAYLESAELGTDDINCRVDFKSANSSSLDYLVIVLIGSSASRHYYRIERAIQQACVKVCNEEGWVIPFPQLTISKAET